MGASPWRAHTLTLTQGLTFRALHTLGPHTPILAHLEVLHTVSPILGTWLPPAASSLDIPGACLSSQAWEVWSRPLRDDLEGVELRAVRGQ